ncbi:Aspartyl aminopeptidase [[Eubacterium] yurii]|jgi:M18 family aminopeptidase|nr:Aspartyl aminopeptidase [[Eubacterium] yurii]
MSREFKAKNIWEEVDHSLIMDYGKRYMDFLDKAKTERLAVKEVVRQSKEHGFVDYDEVMKKGSIKAGDKIIYNHKGKSAVLFVVGEKPIEDGMNIVGAHIDSPRLDIKQNPLYEDTNVALFKTHYYGGVKKYQWTTIPLALHGVVFTKDGKCVEISFGESDDEPVLYINDLLIHLSADQMEKKANKVIEAEQLNIVVGQIPLKTDDKEVKSKVKENILKILEEKYGISERDFATAELEIVPAGKSRSVGFDSSFIAGHGHDDRVCSYAGVEAIFNVEDVEKSAVCLLTDKEEVGSMGNTGMQSRFFENMVANLISLQGDYNDLKIRRAIENSQVLSADVNAAFDPTFPEVMEKLNAAKVAQGVTISKYTGSRGKSGSNDANAEFLSELRMLFDKNDVIWQTGELGKGDQGGGGTIAYILANLGAEVVDCGTSMHSMHAPIELVSKADAYMTMKAYNVFLNR